MAVIFHTYANQRQFDIGSMSSERYIKRWIISVIAGSPPPPDKSATSRYVFTFQILKPED
jgi:hypothetical protein